MGDESVDMGPQTKVDGCLIGPFDCVSSFEVYLENHLPLARTQLMNVREEVRPFRIRAQLNF